VNKFPTVAGQAPAIIAIKASFVIVLGVLLSACATSPKFDTSGVDFRMTPPLAVSKLPAVKGAPVLWGGVIISSDNLKDSTQLEILAYALDANQRPVNEQKPLGRFLAVQAGYLETSDFAAGRLVTVQGILENKRSGQVGEAEYIYPVVKINRIFLWPKQSGSTEPQVQFGFGLMLHN